MRLPGGEASLFVALLTLSTSLSLSVTAVSTLLAPCTPPQRTDPPTPVLLPPDSSSLL